MLTPSPLWLRASGGGLLVVALLASCQQVLTPAAYLTAPPTRCPTVIRADDTMHLVPNQAVRAVSKFVYRLPRSKKDLGSLPLNDSDCTPAPEPLY